MPRKEPQKPLFGNFALLSTTTFPSTASFGLDVCPFISIWLVGPISPLETVAHGSARRNKHNRSGGVWAVGGMPLSLPLYTRVVGAMHCKSVPGLSRFLILVTADIPSRQLRLIDTSIVLCSSETVSYACHLRFQANDGVSQHLPHVFWYSPSPVVWPRIV